MNRVPKNLQIAILFANYGPYHLARVASAYHACKSRGWNLFGIELARSEKEYPWKQNWTKFLFLSIQQLMIFP